MKHNKLLLTLLVAITLPISACSLLGLTSLDEGTYGIYSILDDAESGKDVESYKVKELEMKYVRDESYVPYLSLNDYSELIHPYIKKGYSSYSAENGESAVWMVSNEDGDYVFVAEINAREKTVWVRGSLSSYLTIGKDYSKSSLYTQLDYEGEIVREANKNGSCYYGNTSYKAFRRNSVTYFPLSLLDASFSSYTNIYHLYNYARIIQFDEYDKLSEFKYLVNNKEVTPFKEMKEIKLGLLVMPEYMINDRANAFFYIMDNFYGLSFTRKIGSMVNYYKQQSYYDYFYSYNDDDRNNAFYAAIGLLDDGHSAVREDESAPWYTQAYNYGGSHIQEMVRVRTNLSTSRSAFYQQNNKQVGDILYSTSNKLAFFSFDSFNFDEEAYLADGTTLKPDLDQTDSYFYFVKAFNEIKAHGGVETIVIDVSINGGGVIGVMMKLLALLSKDNAAPMYFMDDTTMMVEKDVAKVDSNGDDEYTISDCYGNSFKFAILTSTYSYSCGNAFPYFASKNGYATIVGQKSGGGECSVEESMLPTGEHFFHSSNLHIGYFDEEKRIWEGDESGAPVDHLIDYSNFYDLEYLDQLLN